MRLRLGNEERRPSPARRGAYRGLCEFASIGGAVGSSRTGFSTPQVCAQLGQPKYSV